MSSGILALYDLRGIQSFIFHSNAVKEIIGGSEIVRVLLEEALEAFVATQADREKHLLDWYDEKKPYDFRFLEDESILSEVLYCGGGNLLVVWRTEELVRAAGRFMNKYVLQNAYSLSLSYATVRMSGSYKDDYEALCKKLDTIKSMGYRAIPISGCPFSAAEQGTGLPAVLRSGEERISWETYLKRKTYQRIAPTLHDKNYCMVIDDITIGMSKNYVGVVHIDGNSMGMRIRDRLTSCKDYPSAVLEMRKLSRRISDTFTNALEETINNQYEVNSKKKLVLRPIICAGDDITFICRADIAIDMVTEFISRIEASSMCDLTDGSPDPNYTFSACAGITYVRTHFPFYTAYELSEQLCAQAKKKAKAETGKDGRVGSFLDFHIVSGAVLDDIETIREAEYVNAQGYSLLQRPLSCHALPARRDSVAMLLADMARFDKLPRSWIKRARNAYTQSQGDVLGVFRQASVYEGREIDEGAMLSADGSRKPRAFEGDDPDKRALYFDALELMDMIPGISSKKGGKADGSKDNKNKDNGNKDN